MILFLSFSRVLYRFIDSAGHDCLKPIVSNCYILQRFHRWKFTHIDHNFQSTKHRSTTKVYIVDTSNILISSRARIYKFLIKKHSENVDSLKHLRKLPVASNSLREKLAAVEVSNDGRIVLFGVVRKMNVLEDPLFRRLLASRAERADKSIDER